MLNQMILMRAAMSNAVSERRNRRHYQVSSALRAEASVNGGAVGAPRARLERSFETSARMTATTPQDGARRR